MKRLAVLLIALFSAAVFAQDLPKIAVYVTGDVSDNEKKALGTKMLASLINSGRYKGIERSNSFLAEIEKEQTKQHSGAVDDSQISELGRQFGVKFVCIADITPAFGAFQVSARIVDVETAEVVFIGEAFSPLQSSDDLAQVSIQVVQNLFKVRTSAAEQAAAEQAAAEQAAADKAAQAVSQAEPEPAEPEPQPEPAAPPPPAPAAPEPKEKQRARLSLGIGANFVSNSGGGLRWDNEEGVAMPNSGGGVYLFFDVIYAEAFAGYNTGGGRFQSEDVDYPYVLPDMQRTYLNVGVFAKYPITAGNIKIFPLLGFDYEWTGGASLNADGYRSVFGAKDNLPGAESLNALWLKLGAGVEADISKRLYLRAEAMYGVRNANEFEREQLESAPAPSFSQVDSQGMYSLPSEARPASGVTLRLGAGIKF